MNDLSNILGNVLLSIYYYNILYIILELFHFVLYIKNFMMSLGMYKIWCWPWSLQPYHTLGLRSSI